jgi:hypothetical protein
MQYSENMAGSEQDSLFEAMQFARITCVGKLAGEFAYVGGRAVQSSEARQFYGVLETVAMRFRAAVTTANVPEYPKPARNAQNPDRR